MQDRDWTGTAAAVTALALTAGVWLWPQETPHRASAPQELASARNADDLARWRAEAQRWDGTGDAVQLSAAGMTEATPAVIR